MNYLLWSPKMQGWMTPAGNYSTDQAEALILLRTDAILYCRKHKASDRYGLLPISLADLEAM